MKKTIHYINEPPAMSDGVDSERNKRRANFIEVLSEYIQHEDLFGDTVTVEFSQKGISSLVCFIEAGGEKFVLKIPLNQSVSALVEAQFLEKWSEVGVRTPIVYRTGEIGHEGTYLLMEYIAAPTLADIGIKSDDYRRLGEMLCRMHSARSVGFGRPVSGRGEFATFRRWLESDDMKSRFAYVTKNNLIHKDIYALYMSALESLVNFADESGQSSYCHFDYSGGHVFSAQDHIVFDPNPTFSHGYIDLGRTLVNYIGHNGTYPREIVEGYRMDGDIEESLLNASIFVNIIYKLPYQHQKNRTQVIEYFKSYLRQYKDTLK